MFLFLFRVEFCKSAFTKPDNMDFAPKQRKSQHKKAAFNVNLSCLAKFGTVSFYKGIKGDKGDTAEDASGHCRNFESVHEKWCPI